MITGLDTPVRYVCACLNVIAHSIPSRFARNSLLIIGLIVSGFSGFAQVVGTVYRDYDRNGLQTATAPTELGVAGIKVCAYVDGAAQSFSTITATDGSFAFSSGIISPGKRVRIEFSNRPLYTYDSPSLTAGSDVQFVQAPAAVNYGISDPADYCQAEPLLVTPVYQTGALQNTGTLVTYPFNAEGQPLTVQDMPSQLATSVDIGTVWATALQRQSNQLVSIGFLKRHAALGTLGLGGIYITNPNTATSTAYVDAGQYLTLASPADLTALAARTLPQSNSTASADAVAFSLVGKVGMGGATFTPSEDKLWVINLYQKTLVRIELGQPIRPATSLTPDAFTSFTIPQTFSTGVNRPWAVSYYQGKLYVGVVNDASISRNRADLKACVYAFDLTTNTFNTTPVLVIPLTYRKGWAVAGADAASSLGDYWEPWSDTWSEYSTNVLSSATTPQMHRVVRPQPILSSIGFDAEGAIIVGLMDRTGHQTSRNQLAPTETSPTPTTVYSGYTGGDLLRAALVNGTYLLEANGSAGSNSGCGVNNGQGPVYTGPGNTTAAGEFYCNEQFTTLNQETFAGSLLSNPRLDNMFVNLFNPLTTWSGGTAFFDVQNGDLLRRYEVYRDALSGLSTSTRSTFGASNGLGQINALCEVAPVSVGNRVWVDTNGDGMQGPAEPPLAGVKLSLYSASGIRLASTISDAQGRYSFQSGPALTLAYNVPYFIVIGSDQTSQQVNTTSHVLTVNSKGYQLTGWNQGTGANPASTDSDAFLLTGSNNAPNLNGLPVMQFQLNVPGQTINTLDVGVQETTPCPSACLQITAQRIR
ncbi:SdrD B-like domain-containing protein [Fibrella arboris]|uniref:SdrD B-like domain-containing protein n=1 Tax=Fibrella arboris TaxID=3242486 RepID=UPI00351FFD08